MSVQVRGIPVIPLTIIMAVLVFRLWMVFVFDQSASTMLSYVTPFSSDQVAQQTILHDWQQGYAESAKTGDDSWFLKWPLYILMNNLPLSPYTQQVLTVGTITTITLSGLYVVLMLFAHKLLATKVKRNIAAFVLGVFIAALPSWSLLYITWPNSRNIELVIFAGILLLLYDLYLESRQGLWKKQRRSVIWLCTLSILLFANDPLFMYLLVPAMAMVAFGEYFLGTRKLIEQVPVLAYIAISVAGAYVTKWSLVMLTPLDLYVHEPVNGSFHQFLVNLPTAAAEMFRVIGADDRLSFSSLIASVLTVLFFVVACVAIYALVRSLRGGKNSSFLWLLVLIPLWNICLYGLVGEKVVGDLAGSRYLIAVILVELFALMYLVKITNYVRHYIMISIVTLSLLVLTLGSYAWTIYNNTKGVYAEHVSLYDSGLLRTIESTGATKGYGNFYFANEVSYLSEYTIKMLPTSCRAASSTDQEIEYLNILSESSLRMSLKADKTFYVAVPEDQYCTVATRLEQFGPPEDVKEVKIDLGKVVYVETYSYDIGSKMGVRELGE